MHPVVIVHPEMGIYLGHSMGLGFWSLMDALGLDTAPVFKTLEQAQEHIRSWENDSNPDDYSFVGISPNDLSPKQEYATIRALKRAGLESILGEMGQKE